MSHYVIIDGQLQKSSPETSRWVRRASKGVPSATEEKPDVVAIPTEDKRSDWEIIQDLEEHDGL